MKAVIMAGGEGTRLRPMTVTSPKPMLPLCNRPVLEYVIDLLKRHGVDTIIITLHYLAEDISSYFGDGSEFGIKIIYSLEQTPLGTAGSIKKIEEYLDETFLVISGDGLTDIDISRLLAFHREKNAIATLTLSIVDKPVEYGVVITGEDGRVQRFLEKPSWGEVFSDQVNTGIYVIEPEVLKLMEPDKVYDFSKDIFPKLLEHERGIYGHVSPNYWCDMGDLDNFRKAVRDLFRGRVLHELAGTEISPKVWIGEGCKISPDVKIEGPVIIGKNCRVSSGTYVGPYTCLGDNCIVAENVYLHRAILFNNVFIGRLSRCTNCIVGKSSTIKPNVILNDGCVLGEDCYVGQGSQVGNKVKIWPHKHIADGSTVSMDIVWGKMNSGVLFGQNGIVGLGNIEITPEYAMRLGAAYGSTLPKGAKVATSRDTHAATRLINRAIITGLNSVGVDVVDCRLNPAPVSRLMISQNEDIVGGIHTRIYQDSPRYVEIEFLDGRGVNIDKNLERKIENLFTRQDFRRTAIDEVGHIDYANDPVGAYCDRFIKHVDVVAFNEAKMKVVIDYSYGSASLVLPTLLSRLGVESINLNAYFDVEKSQKAYANHDQALKQLSDIVVPLKASCGILLDADGEHLDVIDDKGNCVAGDSLLALMSYMMFLAMPEGIIAVPVSASRVINRIAKHCHGQIVRIKTDLRSMMHTASLGQGRLALAGSPTGAFVFPSFSSGVDAFFAGCKLLELVAHSKRNLSELVEKLPEQYSIYASVDCEWSAKAKVMRLLVDLYRDQIIEMVDGVRIRMQGGVALVIPHSTLARLRIWVDGDSEAMAADIMEQLQTVVKELANSNEEEEQRLTRMASKVNLSKAVVLPDERSFHFWIPGRYLGIQARSLRSFIDILRYIEIASLEYHATRRDFSLWIASELGLPHFAKAIADLENRLHGEELREGILHCLGKNIDRDKKKR